MRTLRNLWSSGNAFGNTQKSFCRKRESQKEFSYESLELRKLLATIDWTSGSIIGDSSVSTNGSPVFALSGSADGASGTSVSVNGVSFTHTTRGAAGALAQSQSPGNESITTTLGNDNSNAFLDGGLGDIGEIIRGGWWGAESGNSAEVNLTGLIVGNTYEIQIFANDARSGRGPNYITRVDDGAGGQGVDLALSQGNETAGDYGLGTFTADSSSQSFELTGLLNGAGNSGRIQVNAIQLRNIETVDLLPGAVPLVNEFSASNSSIIDDDNGNSTDWIEIYNAGEDPVNLFGYTLTDDPSNPGKYVFPSTTLGGGGYLVVFAGDDADPSTGSDLYTGFGLSRSGEYLGFFDSDGLLVSEFGVGGSDYPEQFSDVSYGLVANGDFDTNSYFATPTPGFINTSPVDGVIDEVPTVSVDRGFYDVAFDVTISSPAPGATIVYTTDGTEPSLTNGTQVAAANSTSLVQFDLNISTTTPLRTALVREGFLTRGSATHSYVFLDDVITSDVLSTDITSQYTNDELRLGLLDIPTLSFTYETVIRDSDQPEQRASIEWLAPDGSEGFQINAGISGFGGNHISSQGFEKENFRVEFRNQYDGRLEFPLFEGFDNGVAATESFESVEFRGGSHDRILRGFGLSNRFVDDTLLELGHAVPHGRFVHIYSNGEYFGQFHMRERWDADFLAQYYGGQEDDYEAVSGNVNNGQSTPNGWDPGAAYDGDGTAWANIQALADTDGSGNPTGGYAELKEVVNLPQYIDFLLLYMSGNTENEYRGGGSADGSIPYTFYLNDADGWIRSVGDRTGNAGPGNIFGTLVDEANPEFMTLLSDRIQNMFGEGGVLSAERSTERLQKRIDETQHSFVLESARYSATNETRTPESFFNAANNALQNILPSIPSTMLARFRARGLFPDIDVPSFNIGGEFQNGGEIASGDELTLDSSDLIYYTTDGTDPRLEGGGINPNAIAYDPSTVTSTIIEYGADWLYLDDGSNQGTAWRGSNFNDSSWASGASQLGYGGDGEVTTVSYGDDANNKHITTYFRKTFEVTEDFDSAELELFFDDGAVVYLNGIEVGRVNINGTPSYQTLASGTVNNGETTSFTISSDLFVQGSNTLAVEIHQAAATSSDISFNVQLEVATNENPETIPLFTSTNVQARTFSDGEWSAVRNATFVIPVAQSEVRISEIHFNPSDPTAAEIAAGFDNSDDFEFIELFNPNPVGSINLSGIQLSNGVIFNFSDVELLPGQRAVVVEDIDAFFQRYGDDIRVLGEWAGGLSNSGETVALLDADSNEIMSVTYGDNDPWHIPSDGAGFSLVLDQPQTTAVEALGKYYSWRASTEFGGTPGAAPAQATGIVINEILAHTDDPQSDSIELFNPTAAAIDIGGWYLSDAGGSLLKFEIPAGTVISAGGYVVFDESDFNPTPSNPGPNDFALSGSGGDQVYLSRATGGVFASLEDAVEFGATFNGESLGRVPNGTGRLTRLAKNSFGTANGEHEVGSLLISEINYHPAAPTSAALAIDPGLTDNDLEFIEIANPTDSAIDLTDWRIRGEADYDFAAGTSIAAGGTIVVLAFDPGDSLNADKLAAFLEHYGLDSADNLVGGLEGSLSNSSGRIALQQPDTPNATETPRVVVDEVVYDDLTPWADADGSGSSLNRTGPNDFANDANSWNGLAPTPGVSNLVQSVVTSVVIGDGTTQRSSVDSLVLSFLGEVDIASDAFTVIQRSDSDGSTGTVVETSFTTEVVNGNTVVTIDFLSLTRGTQGALQDGNYQLTVEGAKVTRSGTGVPLAEDFVYGAVASDNFYSFYGDINGTRNVNFVDLLAFRNSYLVPSTDANFNAALDYDGNGLVNVLDLLRFRGNFSQTLSFS